jgi:hypothetical protein
MALAIGCFGFGAKGKGENQARNPTTTRAVAGGLFLPDWLGYGKRGNGGVRGLTNLHATVSLNLL